MKTFVNINGKEMEYLDAIYHTSKGVFGLWERIRLLFGRQVIFNVRIYTMNEECKIVGAKTDVSVSPFFQRKSSGMGEMTSTSSGKVKWKSFRKIGSLKYLDKNGNDIDNLKP